MRKTTLFMFFALILSLYGCFPRYYRARYLTLPSTDLDKNVQKAFTSESVCEGSFYNEKWWSFFKDSQLDRFIEISLDCHPDIKVAEARIRLAYNEAKEAKSALYPHFFLVGQMIHADLGEANNDINIAALGLGSSIYEIDIWKKNKSLYYAALDEMQAQIADFKEAQLLLSTAIASAYFSLQMNMKRLSVNQQRLESREELYSILEQQFEFGIISEYRLYEVDSEVQLLKDLIDQIEAEIEIDKHALAALVGNVTYLGGNLEECMSEPSAQFDTPFPLPQTLPIDLLARRPDITAQKWRVEGACYEIKAQEANFFPSIDLFGLAGAMREFITNPSDSLLSLGAAIGILPLFTAGKLTAQLGVTQESLEIAIETYNQTILNAVHQVSDSLTRLITADKRSISLQESIEDARGLSNLTFQKYENGLIDRIPVLNAIENILNQRDMELQVQLMRFLSAVDLMRAIGGGYYDT